MRRIAAAAGSTCSAPAAASSSSSSRSASSASCSSRQSACPSGARNCSGAAGLAAPLFDQSRLADALGQSTDTSFATLHGLYWLTANLAARTLVLLAVDDAHWSDQPSLRWLTYLARRLEGVPVLLLLGLRPAEPTMEDRCSASSSPIRSRP